MQLEQSSPKLCLAIRIYSFGYNCPDSTEPTRVTPSRVLLMLKHKVYAERNVGKIGLRATARAGIYCRFKITPTCEKDVIYAVSFEYAAVSSFRLAACSLGLCLLGDLSNKMPALVMALPPFRLSDRRPLAWVSVYPKVLILEILILDSSWAHCDHGRLLPDYHNSSCEFEQTVPLAMTWRFSIPLRLFLWSASSILSKNICKTGKADHK